MLIVEFFHHGKIVSLFQPRHQFGKGPRVLLVEFDDLIGGLALCGWHLVVVKVFQQSEFLVPRQLLQDLATGRQAGRIRGDFPFAGDTLNILAATVAVHDALVKLGQAVLVCRVLCLRVMDSSQE